MKRPTIALLSLLSLLALGLVAAGPRSCHAGSLGQLAFAIQVEQTAAGDPMVYPLACCPFSEQRDRCEALIEEEAAIELNAAETVADAEQVVDNENIPHDYEYGYDYEGYGDEYSDDYDPYATDEVADEVTADDVADAIVELTTPAASEVTAEEVAAAIVGDMELNAAETNTQDELADDGYDAYYGEYADQYNYDYDYDYDADYNYGYEYEYDSTDYGDEYETDDAQQAEPVATDAEANSDGCQRVCYPVEGESQCKAMEQICDEDLVVEETTDYSDEYYDNYYEQYYSEDFDTENVEAETYNADDTESVEWYEDDYEKYYSQEYYDSLETVGTDEAAPAAEATVVEADAPQYNADAVYDDAVFGERFYEADFYYDVRNDCPTPPVVDETVVAEVVGCTPEAYLAGNCIDEANAQTIDDLPWADEVAEADVDEIDVPVAGEASEYGSDYAEEFFDDQDAELDDDVLPLDAEAAACEAHLPIAAAKTLHSKFDVSRLAAQCGSQVATWTETLAGLGNAVSIACADLESGIETR